MKKYSHVKLINAGSHVAKFEEIVLNEIQSAQDDGFEVDVQYSTTNGQFSALILGYKNQ